MTVSVPKDNWVATSLEDGVRGSVDRSIHEKFPDAGQISFAVLKADGDVWTVSGTWQQPIDGWPGATRIGSFDGTVMIVPGSIPGRTGFQLSVQLELPAMEFGLGFGAPYGTSLSGRTSNDQRSDVFNPTSAEHRATANNRSNQMNRNNPAYLSSRGKK